MSGAPPPEDAPPPDDAVSTDPAAGSGGTTPVGAEPDAPPPPPPAARTHPGVAPKRGGPPRSDPWGFLVRAMAYEVLVVGVTAAAVVVLGFIASLLLFRGELQDVYLRMRGAAPVSGDVALVTIGPEALYLYDPDDPAPPSTPRTLLAEIVRFLDAADASVVVLDFLLDRPTDDDDALASAAAAHGAVIAAERFTVTEPGSGRTFTPGIPPVLERAMASGFANFQEEGTGLWGRDLLVRRVPLVHLTDRAHLSGPWPANQIGTRQDVDQVVPSLALSAAWLHRRRHRDPDADVHHLLRTLADGCGGPPLQCRIGAGDLGLPPLPHPLHVPHDINFRGPETGDGLVTVDAARILRVLATHRILADLGHDAPIEVPEDLRRTLEGRVVVVGRVDTPSGGAADRFVTPYALPFGAEADMSGPRIHAHVIDTLLTGRHIRHVGGGLAWLLGLATGAGVVATYGHLADTWHGLLWLAGAAGLLAAGFVTFILTDGLVFDLGPATAGCLVPLGVLHLRGWVREQAGLAV